MTDYLNQLYEKLDIKLSDVLCWKNEVISGEPQISVHPAGEGRQIERKEKVKGALKGKAFKYLIAFIIFLLMVIGLIAVGIGINGLIKGYQTWIQNPLITIARSDGTTTVIRLQTYYKTINKYMQIIFLQNLEVFSVGGMMFIFSVMIGFFRTNIMGGKGGIGGAKQADTPKILVDNSRKNAPFIDATGHSSAQLFGAISWDPYQTGGLGTPEHQRVTAGDVHRAHLGILYIDEIKNLQPFEAITLLTVLEDGQLAISHRTTGSGATGTSAMAVSTDPVPCLTLLLAAGNFDSIGKMHPALMDRIYGYGRVVRMNNDMPNTLENRRKYVQFIAQEAQRFRLPPFSREACTAIINEGRQRSGKRDTLTNKFRPLISIVKTAAQVAINEGIKLVEERHVKEAIDEHCKTIQKQLLEHQIEERGKFLIIEPDAPPRLGRIYGLYIYSDAYSGERTGGIGRVTGFLKKRGELANSEAKGYYKVTGITKDGKWIDDSIAKVRSVILKRYNVDIAQQYFTHIDFAQAHGVDGPSAGVTMTILLCSLIEGKPIRQDIAITGEVDIESTDEILITAIGGAHEKIKAAEQYGFKTVLIPAENEEHSVNPDDYTIQVRGCATLDEYLEHILIKNDVNKNE